MLVFLASPGDVPKERDIVREVIDELNHAVAPAKDIVLQVVSWENDTFPGYGMDAQALINAQIAKMAKYSLLVGIMWNRLGTPTPRAASGTVEEFERAVAARTQHGQPDIWFYFRQAKAQLDTVEQLEQRKKVVAFMEQVQANGYSVSYKSPTEFRKKFHNQMLLWLNARIGEAKPSPRKEGTQELIQEVLSACSRLAVYTRMHAQLNHDAMFRSLADCRKELQRIVAQIEPKNLQQMVNDVIGELDFIERHREDFEQIDQAKLRIIALLENLSRSAGIAYTLPRSITEEVFWTIEEANQSPTGPESTAKRQKIINEEFDIFLGYSTTAHESVRDLRRQMERAGLKVFDWQGQLLPGSLLPDEVGRAADVCSRAVFVLLDSDPTTIRYNLMKMIGNLAMTKGERNVCVLTEDGVMPQFYTGGTGTLLLELSTKGSAAMIEWARAQNAA